MHAAALGFVFALLIIRLRFFYIILKGIIWQFQQQAY